MAEVISDSLVSEYVRLRGEFPFFCCRLLWWFRDRALGDRLDRDLDLGLRDLPRRDL